MSSKTKQSKYLYKKDSQEKSRESVYFVKDSLPMSGVVARPHIESDVFFRGKRSTRSGQFTVSHGTTLRIIEKALEDKIFPELEPEDAIKEKA